MAFLTSEFLNYIIFRYLYESGFSHSTFTFGYEAGVNRSTMDGNLVPPGSLVKFVQKGIQYLQLETNWSNDETDMDEDFKFLEPLDLITKNVYELRNIVKEKKERLQKDKRMQKGKAKADGQFTGMGSLTADFLNYIVFRYLHESGFSHSTFTFGYEAGMHKSTMDGNLVPPGALVKFVQKGIQYLELETNWGNDETDMVEDFQFITPFDLITKSVYELRNIIKEKKEKLQKDKPMDVMVLEGHTSEVFVCAWSPEGSLLASGSGDSTARIWTIGDGPCNSTIQRRPPNVLVLKHLESRATDKNNDVTSVDWNNEGTLLATGSYDGQARIWNRSGKLVSTLIKHKRPITSLKWNKNGDYLLSSSIDTTAVVWNVESGGLKQQFDFHSGPLLDVAWRKNDSFATSSADKMIYVCKVGVNKAVRTFSGHQNEINGIKWDPSGSLLASCSDDTTVKIWSMKQGVCLHDFREHRKAIYTIKWSPTGAGTSNPNKQLLLASGSFDSTVKLWDVEVGRLLHSLNGHREPVYSVAFSPNGEYLASGSWDKCMNIWSVKEAKIVKTYNGDGGIFDVCWNKDGNKVAASFANKKVCVFDIRL